MAVFTIGRGSGHIFDSLTNEHVEADSPNLIADFSALGLSASKSLSLGLDDASATECALWYCLQAHNISVNQGQLQDTTVKTWGKTRNQNLGATNGNITFTDVPGDINVGLSDMYGMSVSQALAMSAYANTTFTGHVSADGITGVIAPSSDYADGMHRGFDNVDEWVERLANSMTNDIRLNTTTDADDTRYYGTTYTNQVVIVVRWP